MKLTRAFSLSLVALFALSSCTKDEPKTLQKVEHSIDLTAMDAAVDPCQDFYKYSCGSWINKTEIPAGFSRWSRSFNEIDRDNSETLKTVIESYAAEKYSPPVPSAEKLGAYYATCLDEASAENATKQDLAPLLAGLDGIGDKAGLMMALVDLHSMGVDAFFSLGADQDAKDATRVIAILDRAGMGLPEREYYLSEDAAKVKLRTAYVAHIKRMLVLAGAAEDKAADQANKILALETKLAKNSLPASDRRDPAKIYHPIGLKGLTDLSPDISYADYFGSVRLSDTKTMNVTEPEFFKGLNDIVRDTSLEDLKSYAHWQTLRAIAPMLGKAYVDENFDFFERTLRGTKAPLPRWRSCLMATSDAMGEALGEAFVRLKFSQDGKRKVETLVENLRAAVRENFAGIDWMDAETKARAQDKLTKMVKKLAYPDVFRDYSELKIDRMSYLSNELRARAFEHKRVLAKVGLPVDKGEWLMNPHEVNAYFNSSTNEIVFPAAILQMPFYHADAPLASNYGAIGMVIGHEITHAFDDEGRNYDGLGNLNNWWSEASAEKFEKKAQCLIDQYNGYTVSGGVHLDGKNMLGENIADLGGLKLSFQAFQMARKAGAGPEVPGPNDKSLTDEQQFFVSFAQGWCSKYTPEAEQLQAQTNPHALPEYRVNGVVVNLPAFQEVFQCKSGTPMAPTQRCSVW